MLENEDCLFDYIDQDIDYLPFDSSEIASEYLDKFGFHFDDISYEEEYGI